MFSAALFIQFLGSGSQRFLHSASTLYYCIITLQKKLDTAKRLKRIFHVSLVASFLCGKHFSDLSNTVANAPSRTTESADNNHAAKHTPAWQFIETNLPKQFLQESDVKTEDLRQHLRRERCPNGRAQPEVEC